MPVTPTKPFVFQCLACGLLLAVLAACAPEKPEGTETEGLARIAEQLHGRGDDAGAADFYTRAIQHKPNDASIRISFAEILEAHGDNESAAMQYGEALKITPDDGDLLRAYGRVLIKLNHPADARDVYEKALHISPGDIRALNGLGVALDYLNNHDAAQKAYAEALDDKPNDITTLTNLGHSYVLSGAWDSAIKLLEPHLNDPGATPALRQNLAEAYGMADMDTDAMRVSLMDMPVEQAKHNLMYYRAQRTHLSPMDALYADLGNFPTEALAAAQAEEVKSMFPRELGALIVAVRPMVKVVGGTPSFALRVTGFARTDGVRAFCDKLRKEKIPCATRVEM